MSGNKHIKKVQPKKTQGKALQGPKTCLPLEGT